MNNIQDIEVNFQVPTTDIKVSVGIPGPAGADGSTNLTKQGIIDALTYTPAAEGFAIAMATAL